MATPWEIIKHSILRPAKGQHRLFCKDLCCLFKAQNMAFFCNPRRWLLSLSKYAIGLGYAALSERIYEYFAIVRTVIFSRFSRLARLT